MRKILNGQLLYENAVEKLEAGDYPSGIYGLHKAVEAGVGTDAELDLASAYLDVGCISEAQKFYIRVLSKKPREEEAYIGMINCFIETNEQELANYYFVKGLKENILNKEQLEDYFIEEHEDGPEIRLYDSKDKSKLVSIASKLLVSGDNEYAEQLLKSVARPDVKQYTESCSLLSLLYLNQKRLDDAALYADKVLEVEPNDVFALVCRILVSYHKGFDTEVMGYKERLLSLDIRDERLIVKAAVCMMNVGDGENAQKYLEKLLAIQPYDRTALVSMIAVTGAQKKFELAKRYAVTAHKLFPEDVEIRYFATLIREQEQEKLASIMKKGFDGESWLRELESFMVEHSSLSKIEAALKKNPVMRDKLKWLEQCPPCKQQMEILSFFAQSDRWREQSQRLLLLPEFDLHTKKLILKNILINSSKKDFSLYTCGVLRKYKPKKLEREPLSEAYYLAYATMAFVDSGFDKKLYEAYKEIAQSEVGDVAKPAVAAAVMFYLAGGVNVIKTRKDCAEIFGITEEEFMQFVYTTGLEKNYEFE